jgi:hypothetical protein
MTPQAARLYAKPAVETTEEPSRRLAGLLIVSLAPALFWTALLAAGGNALGHQPHALTLATIGAAIAAFLAAVANALASKFS